MKILTTPHMDKCTGCHSCSLACSRLVHRQLSWSCTGIRIESAGGISTGFRAVRCLACNPAPCVEACPTGALIDRKGGGVKVLKKLCIKCGECATACPVDGIFRNQLNEIFVCVHCGMCVDFCPQGCLAYEEIDDLDEVLL